MAKVSINEGSWNNFSSIDIDIKGSAEESKRLQTYCGLKDNYRIFLEIFTNPEIDFSKGYLVLPDIKKPDKISNRIWEKAGSGSSNIDYELFARTVSPVYNSIDYPELFEKSFAEQIGSAESGIFTINETFKLTDNEINAIKSKYTKRFGKAALMSGGAFALGRFIRNKYVEVLSLVGGFTSLALYAYSLNKDDHRIQAAKSRNIVEENLDNIDTSLTNYNYMKGINSSETWKNRNAIAAKSQKDFKTIQDLEESYKNAREQLKYAVDILWASKESLMKTKGLVVHIAGSNDDLHKYYNGIVNNILTEEDVIANLGMQSEVKRDASGTGMFEVDI